MESRSKLSLLPVSLPQSPLPQTFDTGEVISWIKQTFEDVFCPSHFTGDAMWRDTFAVTGTLRTFYSPKGISEAWKSATSAVTFVDLTSFEINEKATLPVTMPNGGGWLNVSATFRTKTSSGLVGHCTAMFSVVYTESQSRWKTWMLRTILDQIEGFPNVDIYTPSEGDTESKSEHSADSPQSSSKSDISISEGEYVDTLVVGGGQSGLSIAGRLQALNVSYLVIDKYKHIGDSWKTRYASTRLHTIREYAHLPFNRTFPNSYQEFLTKDDLAQGYIDWARKYGIDKHVLTETALVSGNWDEEKKLWTVTLNSRGEEVKVLCRFVVMAVGSGGQTPWMPDLPGRVSLVHRYCLSMD